VVAVIKDLKDMLALLGIRGTRRNCRRRRHVGGLAMVRRVVRRLRRVCAL
jgi:hypothetical protein